MGRHRFAGKSYDDERTGYELANEIVRRAGHEDPEAVEPMERFKLVMTHVLKQGPVKLPKGDEAQP